MIQQLCSLEFITEKSKVILTQSLYVNIYSSLIHNSPKLETPTCTLTGEFNKLCYIHAMESHHLAMERTELLTGARIWMNLQHNDAE